MVNVANWITLGRIVAIPIFILTLYLPVSYARVIAAVVFCLIALSDAVDGWVARARKEVSEGGALLDPLADKLLIAAALVFLIGKGVEAWMAFVIIAREFIVTGLRLVAKNITHASYLGKLKTISQVIAIVLVLLNVSFAWHAMLVATILTAVSGVDYLWRSRREMQKALQ